MKYKMLLIDDDETVWDTIRLIIDCEFSDYEIELNCLRSGEEAIQEIALNPKKYAIALVDHDLASARTDLSNEAKANLINGVETARRLLKINPNIQIVMQSGDKTRDLVIKVMGLGITSFIDKPIDANTVTKVLKSYFFRYDKYIRSYEPNTSSKSERQDYIKSISSSIVGQSEGIHKICKRIESLKDSNSRVLITGENGTGKELIAKAIHDNSSRHSKPFVAVNVGAINSNLIESEMFGHEKGAFTGALRRKLGKFQQANGGTLFLDEIGELPLELQSKLLRVLQENEIEIVGGERPIPIDTRVIAATNVNLEKAVEDGKFRADLYHRLKVVPIKIPALRDRKEDIPLLIEAAIKKFWPESKTMKNSTFEILNNYSWPGNVRELMNLMERLGSVPSDVVSEEFLDARMLNEERDKQESIRFEKVDEGISSFVEIDAIQKSLEKKLIVKNLPNYYSIRSAADGMNLSNTRLQRKILEYGIKAEDHLKKKNSKNMSGSIA